MHGQNEFRYYLQSRWVFSWHFNHERCSMTRQPGYLIPNTLPAAATGRFGLHETSLNCVYRLLNCTKGFFNMLPACLFTYNTSLVFLCFIFYCQTFVYCYGQNEIVCSRIERHSMSSFPYTILIKCELIFYGTLAKMYVMWSLVSCILCWYAETTNKKCANFFFNYVILSMRKVQ